MKTKTETPTANPKEKENAKISRFSSTFCVSFISRGSSAWLWNLRSDVYTLRTTQLAHT